MVESLEVLQRTWHVEGQSIRPDHRMVAHTGFLTPGRLSPRSVATGRRRVNALDVVDHRDPHAGARIRGLATRARRSCFAWVGVVHRPGDRRSTSSPRRHRARRHPAGGRAIGVALLFLVVVPRSARRSDSPSAHSYTACSHAQPAPEVGSLGRAAAVGALGLALPGWSSRRWRRRRAGRQCTWRGTSADGGRRSSAGRRTDPGATTAGLGPRRLSGLAVPLRARTVASPPNPGPATRPSMHACSSIGGVPRVDAREGRRLVYDNDHAGGGGSVRGAGIRSSPGTRTSSGGEQPKCRTRRGTLRPGAGDRALDTIPRLRGCSGFRRRPRGHSRAQQSETSAGGVRPIPATTRRSPHGTSVIEDRLRGRHQHLPHRFGRPHVWCSLFEAHAWRSGGTLVNAHGNVIGMAFTIDPGRNTTAYTLQRRDRSGPGAHTPTLVPVDTGKCLRG